MLKQSYLKHEPTIDCWDCLIMSEIGNPSLVWKIIYIICCIVSSYIYAFLAAFGDLDG